MGENLLIINSTLFIVIGLFKWLIHIQCACGGLCCVKHWSISPKLSNYVFNVICSISPFQFSSVQLLSHVRLFVTPWTAACQASLSITNCQSLLKFMTIESVMPSNHLILCYALLLLPSIFASIRVFSNELVLHIRWPKY